jgi:hypothetical protein
LDLGDIILWKDGQCYCYKKNIGSSRFCMEERKIGVVFRKYILQSLA